MVGLNDVTVVRCKDCKYAIMTTDGDRKYCRKIKDEDGFLIECYKPGNWFCADGEVKQVAPWEKEMQNVGQ